MKRIDRWSNVSLFINLRILVEIMLRPSLLSRFKEEIILGTSVSSVVVIKNDLIFKGWK